MPSAEDAAALVDRLTEDLAQTLAGVWQRIVDEQAALAQRWPSGTASARQRQLRSLERAVAALMRDAREVLVVSVPALMEQAAAAGRDAALIDVSAALAGAQIDPQVALAFGGDEVGDLLRATTHVEETTKATVRRLARDHIGDALLTGRPAQAAGDRLRAELEESGISAVTYRDGSRHGLAEYSRMVLRTRTAEVLQAATHATLEAAGVEFVELLDNPSCGLTRHDDPQKANGMVVTLEVARTYPLSHPNCVRTSIPRLDVTSAAQAARAEPSTTRAQTYDQSGVEQEREAKVARKAARTAAANDDPAAAARHRTLAQQLDARAARDYRASLDLRTGAVTSAAELAHIARLEARAGSEAVSAAAARFERRAAAGLLPGQSPGQVET